MVLTGKSLIFVLIVLALWFALMLFATRRSITQLSSEVGASVRSRLTLAGMCFATSTVGSLLFLHLSWISADISQRFGGKLVWILVATLSWSTLIGLILNIIGSGRVRLFGVATCLIAGVWYLFLLFSSAVSMGPSTVRHPVRFLVPDGYVGWVRINHGVSDAPPLPIQDGVIVCRIPDSGLLKTSSHIEDGWAKDEYFYYTQNGLTRLLPQTGWGMGGLIWANSVGWQVNPDGSKPTELQESFFVGTEEQFHRAPQTR